MRRFALLFLSLLILSSTTNAQPRSSCVPFDYPDEPFVGFRFDLDRSMIVVVMEDMGSDTASLFNTLNRLHLRAYKAGHIDKMFDRSMRLQAIMSPYSIWNISTACPRPIHTVGSA